jgi:hypothetical protein
MKRILLSLTTSFFLFSTSYSQDKTFITEFFLDFTGPSQKTINLDSGNYIFEVSGTFCLGSCWNGDTRDVRYYFNDPQQSGIILVDDHNVFTINEYCPQDTTGCTFLSPVETNYQENHLYNYNVTFGESGDQTIYGVADECCWWDNQGGLTFKVYSVETEEDILLKGTVSAESNQIKNVADPTDAQDAVTMAYLQTKLDELSNRVKYLEDNVDVDCGVSYFEDFNSCDLTGYYAQGGNITSTSDGYEGCGVYMTHYAGQDPNNFYAIDKKFLYGVYELDAIADNGISDNIVRVLQQETLDGGYTFSFRPTNTDNPGWSVFNNGELIDSADAFPVARGSWYNIKIEVLKNSLKIWINDVVLFEMDSITPPSDVPGYFKVGVAYSGAFDNLKFTPDSSSCK